MTLSIITVVSACPNPRAWDGLGGTPSEASAVLWRGWPVANGYHNDPLRFAIFYYFSKPRHAADSQGTWSERLSDRCATLLPSSNERGAAFSASSIASMLSAFGLTLPPIVDAGQISRCPRPETG